MKREKDLGGWGESGCCGGVFSCNLFQDKVSGHDRGIGAGMFGE